MGVSMCAQVVEVYMLSRIIETGEHEVLTEEQILTGMRERYGMNWTNHLRNSLFLLSFTTHSCGMLGPLEDGGYVWVYGRTDGLEVQYTDRIHPASIDSYRAYARDGIFEDTEGWEQLFVDAVQVFERIYKRDYKEACREYELEVEGRVTNLEGGNHLVDIPF